MIPPCDPTILDKNPQFKKLHQHLTTNLLSPNGTTRAGEADPARKAVTEVRLRVLFCFKNNIDACIFW